MFTVSVSVNPGIIASAIASVIFTSPLGPVVKVGAQWYIESRIKDLEEQISTLNTELNDSLRENGSLVRHPRFNMRCYN